jgi:integrase
MISPPLAGFFMWCMRELIGLARTLPCCAAVRGRAAVRAGELHALRWHHIDFDRREVRIDPAYR